MGKDCEMTLLNLRRIHYFFHHRSSWRRTRAFAMILPVGIVLALGTPGDVDAKPSTLTFKQDILPIFKAKCVKCHGFFLPQKKLRLSSRKKIMKGGEGGAAVVPANPADSLIYRALEFPVSDPRRMPPAAEKNELTKGEIRKIRDWIAQGAK